LEDPPRGTPPLVRRGVMPGHADLRLVAGYDPPVRLASGKVLGRIQDQAGRLHGKLGATLPGNHGTYIGHVDGDSFSFDRVEPGEYCVVLHSNDDPIHVTPKFTLAPGADLDVGTLVTGPGGALLLRIPRNEGTAALAPKIGLSLEGGGWRTVQPGTADELR